MTLGVTANCTSRDPLWYPKVPNRKGKITLIDQQAYGSLPNLIGWHTLSTEKQTRDLTGSAQKQRGVVGATGGEKSAAYDTGKFIRPMPRPRDCAISWTMATHGARDFFASQSNRDPLAATAAHPPDLHVSTFLSARRAIGDFPGSSRQTSFFSACRRLVPTARPYGKRSLERKLSMFPSLFQSSLCGRQRTRAPRSAIASIMGQSLSNWNLVPYVRVASIFALQIYLEGAIFFAVRYCQSYT